MDAIIGFEIFSSEFNSETTQQSIKNLWGGNTDSSTTIIAKTNFSTLSRLLEI